MCFAAVTLCGTFLLMLPFSSRTGSVELVDALFTATSASCVTGLAVGDTYTFYYYQGAFGAPFYVAEEP